MDDVRMHEPPATRRPVRSGAGLRAQADLATPMAIRVAATLRIADHLAAGPRTAGDIAGAVDADADATARLLDHLVGAGLLTTGDGGYGLTAEGEPLREDHPRSRRAWLDIDGAVGRGDLAFVDLLHSVRTGRPAYERRYGQGFWDDLRADAALSASFDDLMSHHTALDLEGIEDATDWASLGSIVDVGGGDGSLLERLLAVHPRLRGVVVDQEGPVAGAAARFGRHDWTERAGALVGDFFAPLPPGADAYVLSAILHDWDDEDAVAILANCARAAGEDGRVVVIENLGGPDRGTDTAMDLRMLVYTAGRERDTDALIALAHRAGLVPTAPPVPVGRRTGVCVMDLRRQTLERKPEDVFAPIREAG